MPNMESDYFIPTAEWREKYPGAKAGILVVENIENEDLTGKLDERKAEVEAEVRSKFPGFTREELNTVPTIEAYNRYYKNFGKTYHVRSQVESILNGKSLSSASPVLTAMFMAEVKNMLLTAGHDLDTLLLPIKIVIGTGAESYTDIRGAVKTSTPEDMMMVDGEGIVSSIILGPDSRTKIVPQTRNVMFAVYAPAEVSEADMLAHLKDMESSIKLFSPNSETKMLQVFMA